MGDILPGEEKTIEKVIKLKDKIAGNYNLEVYAESQKGFMSEAKQLSVVAVDYQPPRFNVKFVIKDENGDNIVEAQEPAKLLVKILNLGGEAKNVRVKINLPDYLVIQKGKTEYVFSEIPKNGEKDIKIEFVVPGKYAEEIHNIKVEIQTLEKREEARYSFRVNRPLGGETEEKWPNLERYLATSYGTPREFQEDKIALVIGIENYVYLPPSKYSKRDAILMKEIFEKVYRIKTYALINENATLNLIEKTLKILARNAEGKEVYIYYSGHGYVKGKIPAIVPRDVSTNLDPTEIIDMNTIIRKFMQYKPKKIVIITDACYSGYSKEGEKISSGVRPVVLVENKINLPKNGLYASATGPKGKSYSDDELKHGIFTYFLAQGLLFGDENKDKKIEKEELQKYLKKAEEYAHKKGYDDQKPQLIGKLPVVIELPNNSR